MPELDADAWWNIGNELKAIASQLGVLNATLASINSWLSAYAPGGELDQARAELKASTDKAAAMLAAAQSGGTGSRNDVSVPSISGDSTMDLTALIAQMTAADNALDSTALFISSVPAMITAAVQAAIAGGATAAQLVPVTALGTQLATDAAALLTAVAAQTLTPTPTPQQLSKAKGKCPITFKSK
jgi:hypothetical protein